jgi:hypothetical protein
MPTVRLTIRPDQEVEVEDEREVNLLVNQGLVVGAKQGEDPRAFYDFDQQDQDKPRGTSRQAARKE